MQKHDSIKVLVVAWLAVAVLCTVTAGLGIWGNWIVIVLALPVMAMSKIVVEWCRSWPQWGGFERSLGVGLAGTWALHGLGVLVPETGFDAVWYHLPVIRAISEAGGLVFIPDLYQSLNPLWSDLVLASGWELAGEAGVKAVAWLLAVSLILVVYGVSRQLVSRRMAGWGVLVVSTFQVITWQASSAYVDVARSFWEIAAVYVVWRDRERRQWWLAAVLLGAALATKLVVLLVVPLWIVLLVSWYWPSWSGWQIKLKNSLSVLVLMVVPSLPFWFQAWRWSGQPWLSLHLHADQGSHLSAAGSWSDWIVRQLLTLPAVWWQPTLLARDYTSWLLFLALPLVFYLLLKNSLSWRVWWLVGFGLVQLFVYWFIPPTSTRYGLSGFIMWLVMTVVVLEWFGRLSIHWSRAISLVLMLAVVSQLAPRAFVARRQLLYITGQQTKTEYLEQFKDGWIDTPLTKWHALPSR